MTDVTFQVTPAGAISSTTEGLGEPPKSRAVDGTTEKGKTLQMVAVGQGCSSLTGRDRSDLGGHTADFAASQLQ